MSRALRGLVVGAAAAALVVGGAASPASAKTRSFEDARGDAQAALDITRVKVTNKKRAVVVRVTVPGLQRSKLGFVGVAIRTKAKGRPEYSALKMHWDAVGWMPLMLSDDTGEDVPCKGDRIRFGQRTITVRVPQRCLGDNVKAVRVGAAIAARDWLEHEETEPEPGPDAWGDAYPKITGDGLSPWVRYR
ncbi:hypothetical protein FE697_016605 [Mumia zhuanghuii]|uniref:Uncharacterized protein n=2 Tax=Mumia TaxID=1546255 RepID=A0ABW1QRC8_9ACTN|nr:MULTISPECIES: hypothetical protein [Mumia]KAA1420572.1 hypothetical protein FE697_016605 [Mumia zhuanghuii]